jgi:SET domain-containing protein
MNETNEFSFVLKPAAHGVGVFATHDIPQGTRLRVFGDTNPIRLMKKEDVPETLRDWCASRRDVLMCPPDFGYMPIGWYLNHSDEPNAMHDSTETTDTYGEWLAARTIRSGEEITINYNELDEPEDEKKEYYKAA